MFGCRRKSFKSTQRKKSNQKNISVLELSEKQCNLEHFIHFCHKISCSNNMKFALFYRITFSSIGNDRKLKTKDKSFRDKVEKR